jgi:predicted O-methyltransferase YrrM
MLDYPHYESNRAPVHLEQVVAFRESSNNLSFEPKTQVIKKGTIDLVVSPDPEQVKQHALSCMRQLTGWCSETKGMILVDLVLKAKPKIVMEIGVFGGKSLVPMACALQANGQGVIYGVDPWDTYQSLQWLQDEANKTFWSVVDHQGILQDLVTKIEQFHLEDHIVLIKATSADAEPIEEIDILHIDGNHSEETSYFDVMKWAPLVRSGGWIILDDINWYENGTNTTKKATEWLNAHCFPFATFTEQSGWAIWVKP